MKILFLGSSEFSIEALKCVLDSCHKVVAVVCQPDKVAGRGNKIIELPIKKFAKEKGIEVLQFDKVNQHIKEIFSLDFDVFVTASFGQILSREFLAQKLGLNIHPSRLPHLRGATPLQTALMNGEKEIGITVQKMEFEVDCGDVCGCRSLHVENSDDFSSLSIKSGKIGGEILVDVLTNIENKTQKFTPQNHSKATFTKMISKEDGLINFENKAEKIVNQIRALGENPGCFFTILGERIKVKKASVFKDESSEFDVKNFHVGDAFHNKKLFLIMASDGFVKIEICQAQNGKMLDVSSFLNGYKFKSEKVDV